MATKGTLALIGAGLLLLAAPSISTEQAEQRRDARDIRQDTRQDAREAKVDAGLPISRATLSVAKTSVRLKGKAAMKRDIRY